jgi:hypothetical protein
MAFYVGLDLGQSQDYSAACVLEAQGETGAYSYDVRYLEQLPLGTPYPRVVDAIRTLVARPPLLGQVELIIDQTGVGRPIYDMFVEAGLCPVGITITGGVSYHGESAHQYHVAKILLVGTVQKFLQSGRLRIGARLAHASTLQQELRDFRVKVTKAANEVYSAREGQHDDLLLSVACALFAAEHPELRWQPTPTVAPVFDTRPSMWMA